jgi:signal transduction histidine kinase/ActR/RegA family two-component response regulator
MEEARAAMHQSALAPSLDRRPFAGPRASPRRRRLHTEGMRISGRLSLIIAICLLPVVGLQVAVSWGQWAERKAQLGDLAVHQAELLAGDLESIAEGARILLGAAAQSNQIRSQGENCGDRLAGLRRNAAGFAFLALADAEGRIRCSSDPVLLEAGDAAWARGDAVAAEGFTAGRFTRLPGWPGGVLPFYLPLANAGSGAGHVVIAALDLGWLERHLIRLKRAGSPFLANGVLTIADADGVILGRDARHAEFVGKPFPPAAMPLLQATQPGILRLRSIDGTERVVGYTPPTPENLGLSAVVGFHEPELMGDVERALLRGGLLLGAVTASAFGLTLLVARRSIARPTQALLATARRWREGDLAARAPDGDRRSEFGQIAAAYNGMAETLQRREQEARGHTEALEARVAERTRELAQANDRLRAEIAERRNAEAALLQAQKVQAVGQLAGGIAHDFNNVLQAVSGGAALIRRRARDAAAVERLAGMVEDAARRGQSITRRLLAFSRREELRAGALDLGELLEGLREVLGATLGAKIRVEVDAEAGLPSVFADRGQLETVLVNLATNARDAMPSGGTLALSAAAERVEEARDGFAAGDYVRLDVADTGEGMGAETLARAAEPFFTTKPLGQGTGLGLAMARSFAQGSGGALAIASERGRGTRVSLWLPAASEGVNGASVPDAGNQQAPEPVGPGRRRRVLLVDDDPVVREVLATQLADEGYEVDEAGDGAAALALLDRGTPMHMLVSDLAMPGMDGVALIRAAQRRRPGLPAILLTGYAGDAARLAVGEAVGGAFTLLRKPVTGAQLADQVAALLDASQDAPATAA